MLNPTEVNNVLQKANSENIICTMLINQQGSLIAHAGIGNEANRVKGIICSTIWSSYDYKASQNTTTDTCLKSMIVSCKNGNAVVHQVSGDLLCCMFAGKNYDLGLLIAKTEGVSQQLSTQFEDKL